MDELHLGIPHPERETTSWNSRVPFLCCQCCSATCCLSGLPKVCRMPGYAFSVDSLDQIKILSLILKFRTLTKSTGNKIISSKGMKVQSVLTRRKRIPTKENPWWLTGLKFTKSPAAVSEHGASPANLASGRSCRKLPPSPSLTKELLESYFNQQD